MNNKYKFFIITQYSNWEKKCSFVASLEDKGYLYFKDGSMYFNMAHRCYNYDSMSIIKDVLEVNLNKALSTIENKLMIPNILNFLQIRENKSVIITEEIKENILNILKNSRAFNADSALLIKGETNLDIFQTAEEQKLIKSINYNKFYLLSKSI